MSSILICDVLCHKMTMYCYEDYGLLSIMLKLVLLFCVLLLYACISCDKPALKAPIQRDSQNMAYIKSPIYSLINRGTYVIIFIGDMESMNILSYICRLHITHKYIIIFLGIEEYKVLYML
jgi:hypothetical protein